MKKKYNVGDIVFAKSNPGQKLIVCEVFNGYYCKDLESPVLTPQIRFEKELLTSTVLLLSPQKPKPLGVAIKVEALMSIWRNKPEKVEL